MKSIQLGGVYDRSDKIYERRAVLHSKAKPLRPSHSLEDSGFTRCHLAARSQPASCKKPLLVLSK
ncbi:Uncharacterised protein [Chlamydia abortus]|nr:Uncharacterised protein [Chlamydia abortus]